MFHFVMRSEALEVVRVLQNAGFAAFWVGGCVRDALLGREPKDFDIATSALPGDVERLFQRTIPVGRKFGVMVVVVGEHEIQVATFRAEGDYRDGRHPEKVVFSSAQADASRRDFTVNGLFLDPVQNRLHDWVGGQRDLNSRLIRTIGNPSERFAEDHLRMLRAVRFAAQLGFEMEAETAAAIRTHSAEICVISPERIRDELIKLFAPPHGSRGLQLLADSGLMDHVFPELSATQGCDQSPNYHPEGSVFNHLKLMLQHVRESADPLLPWAVLLHDIAKPLTVSRDADGQLHFYEHERVGADMAERIMTRLRFPRRQIETVVKAVRCHMQFKDAPQMRKSTLRRLLMRPTFPLEIELHRLDCLGSHGRLDIHEFLLEQRRALDEKPEIVPPLLKGDDLIRLGCRPGPELGKLLTEVREKQLQDELTTRDQALEWVRDQLQR